MYSHASWLSNNLRIVIASTTKRSWRISKLYNVDERMDFLTLWLIDNRHFCYYHAIIFERENYAGFIFTSCNFLREYLVHNAMNIYYLWKGRKDSESGREKQKVKEIGAKSKNLCPLKEEPFYPFFFSLKCSQKSYNFIPLMQICILSFPCLLFFRLFGILDFMEQPQANITKCNTILNIVTMERIMYITGKSGFNTT